MVVSTVVDSMFSDDECMSHIDLSLMKQQFIDLTVFWLLLMKAN